MTMYRLAAVPALVIAAATVARLFTRGEDVPLSSGRAAAAPDEQVVTEPIRPIEPPSPLDAAKVALGGELFRDVRLSRDGTISCATCHDLRRAGVDLLPRAKGIGGTVGAFNTPTVYNAGLNPVQFWDGRADSLEEQVEGPLLGAGEMGSSWPAAVEALQRDAGYARRFSASYPEGITRASVADAIAVFERSLTTTGSRFDRFLRGDLAALTDEELEGYRTFKAYGCVSCHQGVNVGGNLFQTFGVFGDYFADRGHEGPEDLGRYNVTKRPEDRHQFRVPSLRLAALTPPYFHDGSAATLEEAIRIMARYQLGREIDPRDEQRIVQFLKTLPGPEVLRDAR